MAEDGSNASLLRESGHGKPATRQLKVVKTKPWANSFEITNRPHGLQVCFVLALVLIVPMSKLAYSVIVLVNLSKGDQFAFNMAKPMRDESMTKDEVFLLECLLVISISLISIVMGFVTFIKYPKITQEAMNEYFTYSVVIYMAQLCSTMFVYGTISLVPWQRATVYLVTILDTCSILILRTYVNGPKDIVINSTRIIEMQVLGRHPITQRNSVSEV